MRNVIKAILSDREAGHASPVYIEEYEVGALTSVVDPNSVIDMRDRNVAKYRIENFGGANVSCRLVGLLLPVDEGDSVVLPGEPGANDHTIFLTTTHQIPAGQTDIIITESAAQCAAIGLLFLPAGSSIRVQAVAYQR